MSYTYKSGVSLRTLAQRVILLIRKHWKRHPMDVADEAVGELNLSDVEEEVLFNLINKGLEQGGEVRYINK